MRHPTVVAACLASTARAYGPEALSNETSSPTSAPAPLSAFESRAELLDAIEHWYDDEGHADGWWRGEDRYGPIGAWDTSRVASAASAFSGAAAFNRDVGAWDTAAARTLASIFHGAVAFNRDVGAWDTSRVASLRDAFAVALRFDRDLASWDVAAVEDLDNAFGLAVSFDRDLGWCSPDSVGGQNACAKRNCGVQNRACGPFRSKANLATAVDEWTDGFGTRDLYPDIATWDVSQITDLSGPASSDRSVFSREFRLKM